MSAALERVIAEQQATIDCLQEQVTGQNERNAAIFRQNDELFEAAAKVITKSSGLFDCWKVDKKAEFEEYRALLSELRLALMDAGWCFQCGTLTCSGEFHDDY